MQSQHTVLYFRSPLSLLRFLYRENNGVPNEPVMVESFRANGTSEHIVLTAFYASELSVGETGQLHSRFAFCAFPVGKGSSLDAWLDVAHETLGGEGWELMRGLVWPGDPFPAVLDLVDNQRIRCDEPWEPVAIGEDGSGFVGGDDDEEDEDE